MEEKKTRLNLKWIVLIALLAALLYRFRGEVALGVRLVLGGVTLAFLIEPLTAHLEKHLKPGLAVFVSVALAAAAVSGLVLIFVPPIVTQMGELIASAPSWAGKINGLLAGVNGYLAEYGFPALDASSLNFSLLGGQAGALVSGTATLAGSVMGGLFQMSMAVLLGIYFLSDRQRLKLQFELLIPSRARHIVLRMVSGIGREVRGYLRGQLLIAAIVGVLTAVGLALVGVRSPLALGVIVGLLNLIPYFGPVLGGIPAVLTALGQGLWPALFTVGTLFVVQQLDGMWISPRVMSGVTGLSPAAVLLALTLGGSAYGLAGMLLAIPALLIVRICFRVWASRNEVIEKRPKV